MKNKLLGLIVVMMVLFTTGCGANNYITNSKNQPIKYDVTGQYLQKDILCQPTDKELYNLYKKNDKQMNISIDKLPKCSNFHIDSNKNSSLWDLLLVKPLARLILLTDNIVGNVGLAVIIIGILIRIAVLPFSYKTQKQSINMQNASPEIQKLEKKYKNKTDQESMMMKSQEMMSIYKKHKVSPMSGCLISFIQLPVFFAFWQAVNRVPAIFEGRLFGFNLGMTPSHGLAIGNYSYLILLILIVVSTYYSFKYSMKTAVVQSEEMAKQSKLMLNVMTVMIAFTSLSLSTALGFYWITTYAFIAIQTYIFRLMWSNKKNDKKDKGNTEIKTSNIKDKLKVKEGMKYGKNN